MDTALRHRCQTACAAAFLFLCGLGHGAPPPASPPPAWQNELNAAQLLGVMAASPPQAAAVERAFIDLAAKYPGQFEVQRACGDHFWAADRPDDAVRYWHRAEQLAPGDPAIASALGGANLRLGRVKAAAAYYQRAVDGAPDNALYHYDLGNVLAIFRHELGDAPGADNGEGSLVRALGEFRRAAELAATDRRLSQAYAETFYTLAKPDWTAAIAAWLAVRGLSGEATDFANIHLARISLNRGQANEARGYLNQLKDPAFTSLGDQLRRRAAALEAGHPQRNSSASPSR